MSTPFKDIGKRINDFLSAKEYNLNRTAKINVSSDKVRWSLENKLNKNNDIESELEVSHAFDRDTLSLKTSTIKPPKFEVQTDRLKPRVGVKVSIQDPKLDIKLTQKRPTYCLNVDSTYDWSNQNCDGTLAFAYSGVDQLVLGTKVKVERSQKQQTLGVTDYNVGVQFKRNADQTFAVTTENQLTRIQVGAEFKVRDNYRGYAQVSYNTGQEDQNEQNGSGPVGYAVGIQRNISSTSSIRGVFRNDNTASVLYSTNFPQSNVCAKVAGNVDLTKPYAQRYALQWKLVFGCGSGGKSCCGGAGGKK